MTQQSFKLERVSKTNALVKFHIKNTAGDVVGSVNVAPEEESALLSHWKADPAPVAQAAAGKPNRMVDVMVAAARKRPRASLQAILRGS